MRKIFCLVFALSLFPSLVWSDETIKIGVVDLHRVIAASVGGKRAQQQFRDEAQRVEADLLKEKQEVERLKTELDKDHRPEQEKQEPERRLEQKYRDYTRAVQDSEAELRQRDKEMTQRILDDLRKIVAEIGKKEKFSFILEQSRSLYAGAAVDITDKVIELYDKGQNKPASGAN